MQMFQVKCVTVLAIESESAAEAVNKFIERVAKGGMHFTTEPIKEKQAK